MVSERESTPEKQLLDLIEKPKPGNIHQAATRRKGFSIFSFGALKGRFSFFKKKTKNVLVLKREPLDIKRINKVLRFGVFILGVYFVTSFIISALNLKKEPALALKTEVSKQGKIAKIPSPLKEPSYYLEKVKERDIFNPLPKVTEEVEAGWQVGRATLKIAEAAKNLRLVGISWSNDPDAMIEDTKLSRVYFLKNGEMIGNIKIETIFKDRVVLSYEGEELELR